MIVGGGPRAVGLVERLAANAAELLPADHPLEIHLVDPHPPGGGRVWRPDQPALLRMNSMAEDVTMFTDASSTVEGPIRPGPSLYEWASAPEQFEPYEPVRDPAVRAELRALGPADFATRRAQSAYLDWVFRRTVAELPPHITLTTHRDTARRLSGPPDGTQLVELTDKLLRADHVVLALGHLGNTPDPTTCPTADFAARHGLFHLPPEFTSEADLSGIAPGETLVVRGLGLAFVDLVTLLTEGRGGRYEETPAGLVYRPSGREPVIHAGSRRGVPYYPKTGYRLQGPPPPLPRYFDAAAVDALTARSGPLELRRDVWPLMAKEIGFGHYHELFHGHPERTALPWADFLARYDLLDWYSPELTRLVIDAVPDPADRLDLEAVDRPLAGLTFDSPAKLQHHLLTRIGADTARRADPAHSADLGAFVALLSLFGQLPRLADSRRLTARSAGKELDGWWFGFFNLLASGPPGFRLRELTALAEAGLLHFLGADLRVEPDERTGSYLASSPTVPGHTVHATALVDSFLPKHNLARTGSALLRELHLSGQLLEEILTDADHTHRSGLLVVDPSDSRVIDPSLGSTRHPRRTAIGAPTTARTFAAFARPRTNSPSFRQNDATARSLLRALSDTVARDAQHRAELEETAPHLPLRAAPPAP